MGLTKPSPRVNRWTSHQPPSDAPGSLRQPTARLLAPRSHHAQPHRVHHGPETPITNQSNASRHRGHRPRQDVCDGSRQAACPGSRRSLPDRPPGRGVRPARTERRRQVDDGEDPLDVDQTGRRPRGRRRPRRQQRPRRGPSGHRADLAEVELGADDDRPRERSPGGAHPRDVPLRGAIQGHRAAGPLRAHGRGRPPHQDLQRRHAAQARHRRGPGRPANRALPRRAHDRPRPRGPNADVGRDRPPGCGRTADGPAHDALPRRGGPSRRPARDRRRWSPRRRRHPRRAQGPAQWRRCRRGGRRPDGRNRCRGTPFAPRRAQRRHPRGSGRPGPNPFGRRCHPQRPGVVGPGRRGGRLRHRLPTESRRRLPSLRRPYVRSRGGPIGEVRRVEPRGYRTKSGVPEGADR